MAAELDWTTSISGVAAYLEQLEKNKVHLPLLTVLGQDVVDFAKVTFPETSLNAVYAQKNDREPKGRGAHFDLYDTYLDPKHPRLGVFNLAGTCAVRAAILDPKLAGVYDQLFPEPTAAAWQARRHLSEIAFLIPDSDIRRGELAPNMGLILPQSLDGPYVVHEVTPKEPHHPGAFIKLVVPNTQDTAAMDMITEQGYKPLNRLLTEPVSFKSVVSAAEPAALTEDVTGLGLFD